jgi:hypothetical protein
MEKKIYHITEQQARILINESLASPELMELVGGNKDPNIQKAYPEPISTVPKEVGVGTQQSDEPKPDLRGLPKSPEVKKAYAHLEEAARLLLVGAPKLNEENLTKEIGNLHKKINAIMMEINTKINVNEIDLTN